jgi:hypothetical protein
MTITGGQVVIHETQSDGAAVTFGGSLNAAGEVSGSFCRKGLAACTRFAGTIHDKVFEGAILTSEWPPRPRQLCRSTVGIGAYPESCWTAGAMDTPAIRALSRLRPL